MEEDRLLIEFVKTNGLRKFSLCPNHINGRSSKQCRERWYNVLNPNLKKKNWLLEEDYIIFLLYTKIGSKWSRISKIIGNRSDNCIKNRFYSYLRKNKENNTNQNVKIAAIYSEIKNKLLNEYSNSICILTDDELFKDLTTNGIKTDIVEYLKEKHSLKPPLEFNFETDNRLESLLNTLPSYKENFSFISTYNNININNDPINYTNKAKLLEELEKLERMIKLTKQNLVKFNENY